MSKQGDHVFNDLEGAILAPFETLAQLRSEELQGEDFVNDYLLHAKTLAKNLAEDEFWLATRSIVATSHDEDDVIKELRKLQLQFPSIPVINNEVMNSTHLANAREFGEASEEYERDFLIAMREMLTAVATDAPSDLTPVLTAHIAFQKIVNTAYDPAAAMVAIAKQAMLEDLLDEPATLDLIAALGQIIVRPNPHQWHAPYEVYRLHKTSHTQKLAQSIHQTLQRRDLLSMHGQNLLRVVRSEMTEKDVVGISAEDRKKQYGYMLHLVNQRIMQMHNR